MKKIFLEIILMILLCSAFYSAFRIQSVKAMETIYIQADGSINPPEAAISSLDNLTYTLTGDVNGSIVIERSNMVIDGTYHIVQGDGTGNGFTVEDVVNVTIRNTEIRDCFEGIQFFNSSNNLVTGNTVVENSYEGIGLYFSSDSEIAGNMIANNQIGIAFYNSSSNLAVHNNIMNNTYQAYVEFSLNSWDKGYPSGGNYWSDYTGVDILSGPNQNQPGSDGIGDTPYNVSEDNQDAYPLMQNWTNMAITAISSSRTAVPQGQQTNITVVVENQGWDPATTTVTLYANTTILSTFTNLALSGRDKISLNYTWQTASFDKAKYVINAKATAIPGETDTGDNTLVYGKTISITIMADLNGDGIVDIYDAITLAAAYSSVPTSPNWNGNADINGDNIVDIYDAITLSNNYGKKIE